MKKWYLIETVNGGDEFEKELNATNKNDAIKEALRTISYLTESERKKESAYVVYSDMNESIEKGVSIFEYADECIEL